LFDTGIQRINAGGEVFRHTEAPGVTEWITPLETGSAHGPGGQYHVEGRPDIDLGQQVPLGLWAAAAYRLVASEAGFQLQLATQTGDISLTPIEMPAGRYHEAAASDSVTYFVFKTRPAGTDQHTS